MTIRIASVALVLAAATLLSGCASMGGDFGQGYPQGQPTGGTYPGDYPDGNYPAYPGQYPRSGYPGQGGYTQSVDGTVVVNDPRNGRFRLRPLSYGSEVELWYDGNTTLWYQGQRMDPAGLEPGDGIRAGYVRTGDGRMYAQTIEVTHNARMR